jgi:hypothetical protein
MNQKERDIQRKLRILKHAEEFGSAVKTCRYFGIARASFYRWKALFKSDGVEGLINKKPIPKNPTNRRLTLSRRSFIFARLTISGQSESYGILRATTTSKSQMLAFTAFSSAMAPIACRAAPGFAKFIRSGTKSRFLAIRFRLTLSS